MPDTKALPIGTLLALIQGAVTVVQGFQGSPAVVKTVGYVQEAVTTITNLAPLVQKWANGETVTLEDARTALAGMNTALAQLEADIDATP